MSQTPGEEPELPQELGITLDELTAAYAQSMDARANPGAEPEQPPGGKRPLETATDESAESTENGPPTPMVDSEAIAEAEDSQADDLCPISPRTILEAMLFVGNQENEPLTSARATELMRGVLPGEISTLVDELNHRYASSGCPYRIVSEGAGYRISLDRAFHPVRNKFYGRVREARLSQAALDVLAIVAYRQPIVAEEVNRLRGIPSGHLLAQLVRRQLLRIERQPGKRHHVSYHTTGRFLELFSLDSIEDLPQSEELEKR